MAAINPYHPPANGPDGEQAEERPRRKRRKRRSDERKPEYRLYSPLALVVHTFLFSPIVGGALAAINHKRLGDPRKARQTVVMAVASVVIAALVVGLLESVIGKSVNGAAAGLAGAMAVYFRTEHKPLFEAHLRAGGERQSVLGSTFAGMAVVGAFVGLVLLAGIDSAAAEFDAGVEALRRAEHAAAEQHFRKVLTDDSSRHDARYNLALALYCLDRPDEATSELARIPNDSEVYAKSHALHERAKSARWMGWELMKDHCHGAP